MRICLTVGLLFLHASLTLAEEPLPEQAAAVLKKYCVSCHAGAEPDGGLNLETPAGWNKGGKHGAAFMAGKAAESKLILMVEKKLKPFMPPEDNEAPTAAEIALLKAWIDAGAKPPANAGMPTLEVPKIEVTGPARQPVLAAACSPEGRWLALGRPGRVEILQAGGGDPVQVLAGLTGSVNAVGFSRDGKLFYAAAGEPQLYGELTLFGTGDWKVVRTIRGHNDSLYAAAISADGQLLATGSYDQIIKIWDVATGNELRELKGHNGAVFDLAFHPGGNILASASADRTVKLWNPRTGQRLDTFGQPAKEQNAVAISPDGRYVVGAGVDNRIRVWRIEQQGQEGTNPLIFSCFAHQTAILDLAFTRDGRTLISSAENGTVKLWETRNYTLLRSLEVQPDWPTALAINPDQGTVTVGRLDGTWKSYPVKQPESPRQPPQYEATPRDVAGAVLIPETGSVEGVISEPGQARYYRFTAKAGEAKVIETNAGRQKSPLDTWVEVLHADGQPVLSLQLQAVRDSYITFRPIDSTSREVRARYWEEMELNEYIYMGGEVGQIYRMPEGPDSGLQLYPAGNGQRRLYFGTSATIHALEAPVYIVEPLPADAVPVDNGLPVFPVFYSNDDDPERELGTDSRVLFTAPADGDYLVRVADVRGFGGPDYKYTVTVRAAAPGYNVRVEGKNPNVPPGSGQKVVFKVDRQDGFNGPIQIEAAHLPAGFTLSTPTVIEANHLEAEATLISAPDAKVPTKEEWEKVTLTATAEINGQPIPQQLGNLGEIKLAKPPELTAWLEVDPAADYAKDGSQVIQIVPGTTTTAILKINRGSFDGDIRFDVNNLPHGVIVDNLGLNGITIVKGKHERVLHLTAAPWVPPSTRLIHAVSRGAGNQASPAFPFEVVPAAPDAPE